MILWLFAWAMGLLAAIGLLASARQAAREARCRRHGHQWSVTEYGWTCRCCGYLARPHL